MISTRPAQRPFWMTPARSRAFGTCLAQALQDGLLNHGDYAAAADHCRKCPEDKTCSRWSGVNDPGTALPPACCANAPLMIELRQG